MIYTLPWYAKAGLVVYDVIRCWLVKKEPTIADEQSVYNSTYSVFALQAMILLMLMAPSACLSVAERVQTNRFCCNVLSLLSIYLLVIKCMRKGLVSSEHTCFLLQFGSCYCFFCFYELVGKTPQLLVGRNVVRVISAAGIFVFPLLYSHIIPNCMHVSPYALAFVFSAEVCACIGFVASNLIFALEMVLDTVYTRAQEM